MIHTDYFILSNHTDQRYPRSTISTQITQIVYDERRKIYLINHTDQRHQRSIKTLPGSLNSTGGW
jgi:hypothetical protein